TGRRLFRLFDHPPLRLNSAEGRDWAGRWERAGGGRMGEGGPGEAGAETAVSSWAAGCLGAKEKKGSEHARASGM
ncbi:hypothetical protein LTR28_002656, partial [Elasticomyces elasticus]